MAKGTSGKSALVIVAVLAVVGLGAAYFVVGGTESTEPAATKTAADDPNREMSEEERASYITDHVRVDALEIVDDTKPGLDEVVPGLKRVVGTVVNNGPRKLHTAYLHIYPKDDTGNVLGSFVENVAKKGGPLGPGETREFMFTIPDKKGFAGDFGHTLR